MYPIGTFLDNGEGTIFEVIDSEIVTGIPGLVGFYGKIVSGLNNLPVHVQRQYTQLDPDWSWKIATTWQNQQEIKKLLKVG